MIDENQCNAVFTSGNTPTVLNVMNGVSCSPRSDGSVEKSSVCVLFTKPADSGLLPSSRFLLPVKVRELTAVVGLSLDQNKAHGVPNQSFLDSNQRMLTTLNPISGITKDLLGPGDKMILRAASFLTKW